MYLLFFPINRKGVLILFEVMFKICVVFYSIWSYNEKKHTKVRYLYESQHIKVVIQQIICP